MVKPFEAFETVMSTNSYTEPIIDTRFGAAKCTKDDPDADGYSAAGSDEEEEEDDEEEEDEDEDE